MERARAAGRVTSNKRHTRGGEFGALTRFGARPARLRRAFVPCACNITTVIEHCPCPFIRGLKNESLIWKARPISDNGSYVAPSAVWAVMRFVLVVTSLKEGLFYFRGKATGRLDVWSAGPATGTKGSLMGRASPSLAPSKSPGARLFQFQNLFCFFEEFFKLYGFCKEAFYFKGFLFKF